MGKNNKKRQAIDDVWECIFEADGTSAIDERRTFLRVGMQKLEAALTEFSHDADLKYHMALLWSRWPDEPTEALENSYVWLNSALCDDPEHVQARMQLGFNQFEEGKYAEAIESFEKISGDSVGDPSATWQFLKVAELSVCCKLRIDWSRVNIKDLERLCSTYDSYKMRIEPPAPVEIARTALALCANVTDRRYLQIVAAVVHLIKRVEGPDGGALSYELKLLEAYLEGRTVIAS